MPMYPDSQILKMLANCNFDSLHSHNFYEKVSSCLDMTAGKKMEQNYWIENGASKLVIGWSHKNWVIKIPFSCYDSSYYSGGDLPDSAYTKIKESFTDSRGYHNYAEWDVKSSYERSESYDLYDFEAAENSLNCWDYCRSEMEIYQAACRAGMNLFFAETRLVGYVNGYPIYMQRKADTIGGHDKDYDDYEKSVRKSADDIAHNHLLRWHHAAEIITNFGVEMAEAFGEFMDSFDITDMHSGNYGSLNGQLLLVDYSGYHE